MTYCEMSLVDLTHPVQPEIDALLNRIGPLQHEDGDYLTGEQAMFSLRCAVAYSAILAGDFGRETRCAGAMAVESAMAGTTDRLMRRATKMAPDDFLRQVNRIGDLAVERLQA